jgi:hypothetical protein
VRGQEILTSIPEPIKRQVRQEGGFGCCKCGNPIIDYHHIVEDSQNPKDIMLLCPDDHREATAGAMLEDEQRLHKANPINIKKGFVEGLLKINQTSPVVTIGSNQFVGDGNFILIDGENLLSIEVNEGRIELSMRLYDQKDNLVAEVKRNEWISGDPFPWDLESKFQWLRIRRKLRDIALEIDVRKYPIDVRAEMWRHGQKFELNPDQILFNGVVTHVSLSNICFVAAQLGIDTSKKTFTMSPDPRFGQWSVITNADIKERVKVGLRIWEELTCEHKFVTILDRRKYIVKECSKCKKMEKIWK